MLSLSQFSDTVSLGNRTLLGSRRPDGPKIKLYALSPLPLTPSLQACTLRGQRNAIQSPDESLPLGGGAWGPGLKETSSGVVLNGMTKRLG